MQRRTLLAAVALAVIPLAAACTPEEIAQWEALHAADPQAAADLVAPAPAPEPEPDNSVWDDLAECESGGDWGIDTGNGYYGGLQFSLSSWRSVGGSGYPNDHSRDEQIHRAELLLDEQGWGAWPACSRQLGLR
jgi:transglycosylase-like protein